MTTEFSPAHLTGASWRPVIILVIVLGAAAGLTFWILFGGQTATIGEPVERSDWQTTPSAVVDVPSDSPIWASPGVGQVDPIAGSAASARVDSPAYPRTEYPDAWNLARVATAVEPFVERGTADKQASPVVSFQGKIETPDFRARHDRQQPSLY